MLFEDTIAAISTPVAIGGLGVIRLSGPQAITIAQQIFKSVSGKMLSDIKGYTALFGHVTEGEQTIDECIALVFKAPKSFTGEDVVELSCHGGIYIVKKVLRLCLQAGARMAEPGEFSKRAFLNGKMDLTQAEGIVDLINAKTSQSAAAALSVMDGRLYQQICEVRNELIDLSAQLAAYIDYPDDEIEELTENPVRDRLLPCMDKLQTLIDNYDRGAMIKNGVNTVIVGKPNVGKSTWMNLLAGREKSIVTQIPGTTRDVVEESIVLDDVILNLADTAGIRETDDPVEKIGVGRAKDYLKKAQLVLAIFDYSHPLDDEDKELLQQLPESSIIIVNKTDLPGILDVEILKNKGVPVLLLSAMQPNALKELQQAVRKCLHLQQLDLSGGILANERQLSSTVQAKNAVNKALDALNAGFTLDAVAVDIDTAIQNLYEMTGEHASDEVIARIFENFCVGK